MKLIAHGGYSAKYPENTLESFVEASKFNPFAIEMDVVDHPETGELICFHPTGISSNSGTFSKETIMKQIDEGESFPLVNDVLKQIPIAIKILLDFKQPSEEVFRNLINSNIDLERVIVGVRNMDLFNFIKESNNKISVLALFAEPDKYVSFAQSGGKYFRIWEKDVNAERVDAIHEAGLEVWITPGYKATETRPRTAGDISNERLGYFLSLGVDAVLVNDIKLASEYLGD